LLQYRFDYDKHYMSKVNNHYDYAGDTFDFSQSMINTYATLDKLIEWCNFNSEQIEIIIMIQKGYTYQEIADKFGLSKNDNIRKKFNKICKDIVVTNNRIWRKYIYTNKLNLKTKKCSKCKEELPAVNEFFRGRTDGYGDGFYNF